MTATATKVWNNLLQRVLDNGLIVDSRAGPTTEFLGSREVIDLDYPVVGNETRDLNYKFMFNEALFIILGGCRLDQLPTCKNMSKFSDDGTHLSGAYGPMFAMQVPYVVRKLLRDYTTRQAVMSIWRPSPGESADIPCTLTLHWIVRDDLLHCFVNMRSSDVWLGCPYDWFNFAMMTKYVQLEAVPSVGLGNLWYTATSSHLYLKEDLVHLYDKCVKDMSDTLYQVDPAVRTSAQLIEWLREGVEDGTKNFFQTF